MIRFFDTSALVKRYLRERGSAAVRAALRRGSAAAARITYAELHCALARAAREGVISQDQRDAAQDQVDRDFDELTVVEIRPRLVLAVRSLALRYPLRAYDAVQLASARALAQRGAAVEMWSADEALSRFARNEGLKAVVPRD